MEKILMGNTGPQMAPLGLGAWAWGDRLWWGWGRDYGKDDIRAAFEASLASGVTLIDTAEVYGNGQSERLLGELIRDSGAQVYIASKCFPYPWRVARKSLLRALRGSLRRLDVAHIDLYQMHWPTPMVAPERWMDAMADAAEAGLINQVGVSNYGRRELEAAQRALERRGLKLASNQINFSLLQRGPEFSGLLDLCQDLGVTVIAYSPLGQGLLTGKYNPENPPSGIRGLRYRRQQLQHAGQIVMAMRKIGEKHGGRTPAQVALNWCIAKGTIPIPGAKNARQATENAGALGWSLSAEEVAELDEISRV